MTKPMLAYIVPLPDPGQADNSLPGGQGGRPSNTLPNAPVRPGQGLPGGQGGQAGTLPSHDEAWVLVFSPHSGYHWSSVRDLVSQRPDQGLPGQPNVPSQGLPQPPNVAGQPMRTRPAGTLPAPIVVSASASASRISQLRW